MGPSELPPYFRAVALAPAAGELRRKVADGRRVYLRLRRQDRRRESERREAYEQVRRRHEVVERVERVAAEDELDAGRPDI